MISGVSASLRVRKEPVCFTPAASSASRVRFTPWYPWSRVWLEAVEQVS